MRVALLSFLLLLAAVHLNAQPVLDSRYGPQGVAYGSTAYSGFPADSIRQLPNPTGGAGQVWTFQADPGHGPQTFYYGAAVGIDTARSQWTYGSEFPRATHLSFVSNHNSFGSNFFNSYLVDTTVGLLEIGDEVYHNYAVTHGNGPNLSIYRIKYGFNLGEIYINFFSRNYVNPYSTEVYNDTVSFWGHGTLILNGDSLADVALLRTATQSTNAPFLYPSYRFEWYLPGMGYPVLTLADNRTDTLPAYLAYPGYVEKTVITENRHRAGEAGLRFYPNPAHNCLQLINAGQSSEASALVISSLGIRTTLALCNGKLAVDLLPQGFYQVYVEGRSGRFVKE